MAERRRHPLPAQVVPLALSAEVTARLSALRALFTPAERVALPAHLTLMHAVPSACLFELDSALEGLVAQLLPAPVRLGPARPLGRRGVAVFAEAPVAGRLRRAVQHAVGLGHLTAQDAGHGHRPHLTLARQLEPGEAGACLARATASWSSCRAEAIGVDSWDYLGGLWRHRKHFAAAPRAQLAPGT